MRFIICKAALEEKEKRNSQKQNNEVRFNRSVNHILCQRFMRSAHRKSYLECGCSIDILGKINELDTSYLNL